MNAANPQQSKGAKSPAAEPLLQQRVAHSVRRYLADLDNTECRQGLYSLMLGEVERPMLDEVMKWHDGNQSRAAATLGINRATLRKKLQQHGLL